MPKSTQSSELGIPEFKGMLSRISMYFWVVYLGYLTSLGSSLQELSLSDALNGIEVHPEFCILRASG